MVTDFKNWFVTFEKDQRFRTECVYIQFRGIQSVFLQGSTGRKTEFLGVWNEEINLNLCGRPFFLLLQNSRDCVGVRISVNICACV